MKYRIVGKYTALTLLFLGAAFSVFLERVPQPKFPDYIIPGVQPITRFSEGVLDSFLRQMDVAGIATVLQYWGSPVHPYDPEEIQAIGAFFRGTEPFVTLRRYLLARGFTIRSETLPTPADLKKYINPDARTPLLVGMRATPAIPGSVAYRVLIGVNEERRVLVMHDFVLGNNLEVSFDEYESWWAGHLPERRHRYTIIQPIDFTEALRFRPADPEPYPARPAFLDKFGPLLVRYYQGAWFSNGDPTADPEESSRILQELAGDPLFDELHPYLKARTYALLARNSVRLERLDEAKAYLDFAFQYNRRLRVPYENWPALAHTFHPFITLVAEEYYNAIGDMKQAEAHRNAVTEEIKAIIKTRKDIAPSGD